MAVGPNGEVVAIGYMEQLGADDSSVLDNRMLVVKYDSTGSIQWQKAILFDEGFDCSGADADIDSDGNIYVTGGYQYYDSVNDTNTSALSILKLDGTGVKQWSRRVQGDCETFGVSVVVGADDKLYLSGITGNNNTENNAFTWVAAKYGIDGTVEWQRLIDNTTGWTFTGGVFFSDGGGSNIAVKDGYVLLGGGFGNLAEDIPRATVVQVSAAGDVFSVGDWDFKAASFSGVLNGTASDITVVNAGKTDTDNAENITTSTVTLTTEVSGFLLGTLYTVGDSNDRLVNGEYEIVLGSTGTVTLPSGGTITEGVVTDNPTIELTPANPDAASQKLVIKGGLPPEEPTDYHLHLTTGDLSETSIFLGTDDHNVRTTTDGKIQITTPGEGNNVWEFGTDGGLTFPDATVQTTAFTGITTVAKTGVADLNANDMSFEVTAVDESGVVTEVTITNTPNIAWQSNGAGTGVTVGDLSFTVQVDGSGNATVSGITSSGGHTIGETFTTGGDSFGAEILPTAIDLTKTVNKLTPGNYSLADGVEGQVMYLVRQTGTINTVIISVAHARNGASEYTDYPHYPFAGTSSNDLTTLIFTDGHWQSSGDSWD
jgi:hypothetical protein